MSQENLKDSAWQSFNAAFNSSLPQYDREIGHELYRQAIHEEIESAFKRSDSQNRLIDMAAGKEVTLQHNSGEPLSQGAQLRTQS